MKTTNKINKKKWFELKNKINSYEDLKWRDSYCASASYLLYDQIVDDLVNDIDGEITDAELYDRISEYFEDFVANNQD